jgi:hypothetical protein
MTHPVLSVDTIDAVLLCAIGAYESGDARPLDLNDTALRWSGGLLEFTGTERRVLHQFRSGDLDFTDLVVPALVTALLRDHGVDWTVEALTRTSRLIGQRLPRLAVCAARAAAAGAVHVTGPAPDILAQAGFPGPQDQVTWTVTT